MSEHALHETSDGEHMVTIGDVVRQYASDFALLSSYDRGEFNDPDGAQPSWSMGVDDAREVVRELRDQFPADELLGAERTDDSLAAVLDQIEQTAFGEPLYPTVEDRSAHLIYLTVKNHPFSDGNKRSAAALAGYYWARNDGAPLPANTLASLTLVAAASAAEQKDQIVGVIRTVLSSHNADRER